MRCANARSAAEWLLNMMATAIKVNVIKQILITIKEILVLIDIFENQLIVAAS